MTDLMTDLPKVSEDNFRLQGQKYLLTYKTHLDKVLYPRFLASLKADVKRIYMAHENGAGDPVTPYEHTHVVVDWGSTFQSRNVRILDFNEIHPHISKITKKESWKKACKYICKEDKSVVLDPEDSFSQENFITHLWNQATIQDALQEAAQIRDVPAIIAAYNCRPGFGAPERWLLETPYEWQQELIDELMGEPSDRKVIWIMDHHGSNGKTRLAEHLEYLGRAESFSNIGRVADFIMNMKAVMDGGFQGNTIFLNLARSMEHCEHIYTVIEQIKDQKLYATKYTGGKVYLPLLHVVILSNWMPRTEALSADRWDIRILNNLKLSPWKGAP